jgi:transposase
MEYFAGLDVSMEETHVIVVDRDGKVILETRTPTAPKTIAAALAKGPAVERVLFETGRMAPMLFHGLTALGLPVVCVESRQAYQALRSLAVHKTDRKDARGLAHLARTGFFKPVHVKSLPSHAVRALLVARKKLVGQRVTLENQIRGLAVAFGVRLPRGLSSGIAEKAMAAGCGIPGLDGAMRVLRCRGRALRNPDHSAPGLGSRFGSMTPNPGAPYNLFNCRFFSDFDNGRRLVCV